MRTVSLSLHSLEHEHISKEKKESDGAIKPLPHSYVTTVNQSHCEVGVSGGVVDSESCCQKQPFQFDQWKGGF